MALQALMWVIRHVLLEGKGRDVIIQVNISRNSWVFDGQHFACGYRETSQDAQMPYKEMLFLSLTGVGGLDQSQLRGKYAESEGSTVQPRISQPSGRASLAQYAPVQQQHLQLKPPSPNWCRQAPCSCPFLLDQASLRLSRDWVADLVVKTRRPHSYWPIRTVTYFSFPSDWLFSLSPG